MIHTVMRKSCPDHNDLKVFIKHGDYIKELEIIDAKDMCNYSCNSAQCK